MDSKALLDVGMQTRFREERLRFMKEKPAWGRCSSFCVLTAPMLIALHIQLVFMPKKKKQERAS